MRKRPPQPQRLERGAPRERRSAALPARGHGAPQRPRADTAQMTARRGGCGNSWRRSGRGDGARGAADMPDRARPAVRLGSAQRPQPDGTGPAPQLCPPLAARRAGPGRARQRGGRGRRVSAGEAETRRSAPPPRSGRTVPDTNTTKTELCCLAAAMAAGMEPPNHIMVTAGLRSRDSPTAHAPRPPLRRANLPSRACAGGPSPAF